MDALDLPLVLAPESLAEVLGDDRVLVVEVRKPESHAQAHIPGAVRLDYAAIVASRPPAGGLLPDDARLSEALSDLGLRPEHRVVACDEEGGGRAARLVWTLDVLGHPGGASMLDGGLPAWAGEGRPLEGGASRPEPSGYEARVGETGRADRDYLLSRLGAPDVAIVDCRSPGEFAGTDVRAARGGHVPGAVNFEWTQAIDPARSSRLRPAEEIRARLESMGVTPEREAIAYCQTHHRSSHTYVVLRWLGYPRVRGYEGSWSEWGNDPEVPVEVGSVG